jgi:flavorubredoxin
MFPTLSQFLTYTAGLKPKGKLWGFFGSYGWGGGAVKGMIEMAKKADFEVYDQSVEVKYVPDQEDLKKCFEFGQKTAQKIKT